MGIKHASKIIKELEKGKPLNKTTLKELARCDTKTIDEALYFLYENDHITEIYKGKRRYFMLKYQYGNLNYNEM